MYQRFGLLFITVLLGVSLLPVGECVAQTPSKGDEFVVGFKVRFGGLYDDVRMCVASDPGTKGCIAADVSLFMDFGVNSDWFIHVDLPVFRPILYAVAFDMLQFEPSVGAHRRISTGGDVDVILGPTLGVSLHYGPDYRSGQSSSERGPAFFAMGPTFGGYFGLDFLRRGKPFNFQLGVSPYVTPLFGIADDENHSGFVVGGLVDALFQWGAN